MPNVNLPSIISRNSIDIVITSHENEKMIGLNNPKKSQINSFSTILLAVQGPRQENRRVLNTLQYKRDVIVEAYCILTKN